MAALVVPAETFLATQPSGGHGCTPRNLLGRALCYDLPTVFSSPRPHIDQVVRSPDQHGVMLHNDHDPYTVALFVPNRDAVRSYLRKKGLSCLTEEGQEAALSLFQDAIDAFRKGGEREGLFETEWLPAAFAVLGDGFTEENQMLNSTMKLVRRRVAEFYRNRIEYLHTPEGKDPFDRRNRTIISRLEE